MQFTAAQLDDAYSWLCRRRRHFPSDADIGCGNGRATHLVARDAARVLGVDTDEAAIAVARASTPQEQRTRVSFRVADVVTVDLDPAGFDVVMWSRSL